MTSPFGGPTLPQAITEQQVDSAVMRVGTIVSMSLGYVTVRLSGSTVLTDAPYMIGQYWPSLGDTVTLLKQGSQWVVWGELSSIPDANVVANPSFEDSAAGATPANWTVYLNPANTMTITVTVENALNHRMDGERALRVDCDPVVSGTHLETQTSTAVISSDPFPVVPGERWAMSAWLTGHGASKGTTFDATARCIFAAYTNFGDVYPTAAVDTKSTGITPVPHDMQWTRLRLSSTLVSEDGYEIPAGATWGRVLLEVNFDRDLGTPVDGIEYNYVGNFPVYFDRVQAIRVI